MTEPKETYLGDGLYASFDGDRITLRDEASDDIVFLDKQRFLGLLRFMRKTAAEDNDHWMRKSVKSISSKKER